MSEHRELMQEMGITRAEYLTALRKEQPIEELRRKALKSVRFKGRLWTQEQIDLIVAESEQMLTKIVMADSV